MTDVRLLQTNDGGEIEIKNGLVTMSDGLYEAVYLSCFGGNERDSGLDGDRYQWWGNIGEPVSARRYRAETQHLLRSMPAIPANLKRVQEAAERDLTWMVETRLATLVSALASMPALSRVRLRINVIIGDRRFESVINERWGAVAA